MQLKWYDNCVFGFCMWLQESKYVFGFSYLINAENKSASKSVGKVFLMIKIGLGFMGSRVYSLVKF
jgi:hypothetical protein